MLVFVVCDVRRNVAVRPGRARCFRRRFLRTEGAGLARHRTDRLLAAVVASRAATFAAWRRLVPHLIAVAVPDSQNNHLDHRAEAGKQGRAVWRHARGSLAAEAEATLSDYTGAS